MKLPAGSQIHDVFHVSQLKMFHGVVLEVSNSPDWFSHVQKDSTPQPFAMLDKRMIKHHNATQFQYLIQWEGCPPHESTWEDTAEFVQKHPHFLIQFQQT